MVNYSELEKLSTQVRRDVLRMIHAAKSGHPGAALGCADFFTVLYKIILNHHPEKFSMTGENEDLFFLSNGHLSAVWYSILARCGYFSIKELSTYRKLHSRLQGHPATAEGLEGIRIASGSLGQGLSVAIGAAIAKKMNHDNCLVYVLLGDGELQEGQNWEAIMFAGAKKTNNLIAIIDYNGKQIDGPVEQVVSLGKLKESWQSFNWSLIEMNGNDLRDVFETLLKAKEMTSNNKPVVIFMKTEMGFGVDFMMGTHKWHGQAPNDEQLAIALAQLNETLGDY